MYGDPESQALPTDYLVIERLRGQLRAAEERLRKLEAVWEAAIEQRDSLRSHEAINGRLRDALSALDAEVKK